MDKRYKEAANLIEATDELLLYFRDYLTTQPEIKNLKEERDRLAKELRLQVLEDFGSMGQGAIKEQLQEACLVMSAIGGQAISDLRTWYSQYFLEPYRELFEPGKQHATFENTKRRFAWYKRTVKESEAQFEDVFPTSWQMQELNAYEFCRTTKVHLDTILSTSFQDIDVQLIIEAMQQATEFENQLQTQFYPQDAPRDPSFKTFKFSGCISQCFEPYLKSYSDAEARKLAAEVEQRCQKDELETIDFVVFSSSLYLFKEVKASLRRCLTFSRQKALFDLTVAFKNTLRLYSQLLKRKLPVKSGEQAVQLSDEQELACAHIVNTCEYCLETVPKLHSQIEDVIEGFEVDLQESATAPFRELINFVANALVRSITLKTEAIYTS